MMSLVSGIIQWSGEDKYYEKQSFKFTFEIDRNIVERNKFI